MFEAIATFNRTLVYFEISRPILTAIQIVRGCDQTRPIDQDDLSVSFRLISCGYPLTDALTETVVKLVSNSCITKSVVWKITAVEYSRSFIEYEDLVSILSDQITKTIKIIRLLTILGLIYKPWEFTTII